MIFCLLLLLISVTIQTILIGGITMNGIWSLKNVSASTLRNGTYQLAYKVSDSDAPLYHQHVFKYNEARAMLDIADSDAVREYSAVDGFKDFALHQKLWNNGVHDIIAKILINNKLTWAFAWEVYLREMLSIEAKAN